MKKLIIASALLGALCVPALAGGGNDQVRITIIRATMVVVPMGYLARSLAPGFLHSP
jgi:hypothetical protein